MENFKEIAEKCLAGELSGTFIFNNGKSIHSTFLMRYNIGKVIIPDYYFIFNNLIDKDGNNYLCNNNVINFISDIQEQIKIDIPEGMEVIREESPGEIKIKCGVYFYTLDDVPEVEFHCDKDSAMGLLMVVDELDPIKEMIGLENVTKYRFDDRITKIVNFDNSDIDIPEDYYFI